MVKKIVRVYCIFLLINIQHLWHKVYKGLPSTDNSLLAVDNGSTLVKTKMESTCGYVCSLLNDPSDSVKRNECTNKPHTSYTQYSTPRRRENKAEYELSPGEGVKATGA